MILCIETATDICSAALCSREEVISVRRSEEGRTHASSLTVFIKELLEEQDVHVRDLEAVAVGKGPGSYTGLRIGAAVAKGVSYASGIPLIAVDSLSVMFYGMKESEEGRRYDGAETLFCPMIDARRMEAYYCLISSAGEKLTGISAGQLETGLFSDKVRGKRILFFGSGSGKFEKMINHPEGIFISGFETSAAYLRTPAFMALKNNIFENTISFEPFYLKDFIAIKPRRKII